MISVVILIVTVFIFTLIKNNRTLLGPDPEELSSIVFINMIDDIGSETITITQESNISKTLEIFGNSKITSQQIVSDFPKKAKYTVVLHKFKSGGNSFRSIYKENQNIYVDQTYNGIYKMESKDLKDLDDLIKKGNKEEREVTIDDIFNGNF